MGTWRFILNFHGIGEPGRPLWPGEDRYWIDRSLFEAILDVVKDRADVDLTFDDGNVSDYEIALPGLLRRGMKAQFFVVSDLIGRRGFLSHAQVKELHRAGMTIGNHGKLHRSWRELPEPELRLELIEARAQIENLIGARVDAAACPNGSYGRRVLSYLKANGYARSYTSDRGWTCRSSWLQARNSLLREQRLEDIRNSLEHGPYTPGQVLGWGKRLIKRCR